VAASTNARQSLNGDAVRVLIIDDDHRHAELVAEALDRTGYDCTVATSGVDGAELIENEDFDVILTDLRMSDVDGLAILRKAREQSPEAEVVMITGYGDVKSAVEAIKQGASNYLTKPVDLDELRAIVQKVSERGRLARKNRELMQQLDEKFGFAGVIGNSAAMQEVVKKMRAAAPTDATVLLLGETGTGKDLIARAIHNNSNRKNKHFATLNCAAPNENLIEDELFGHEAHSFTGGDKMRKGIFEYANGGTVFLDEIGDMPYKLQAKLLRVLENREVTRIGSNEPIKVNIRLISATHRDLESAIAAKEFRMDLYQRLKAFVIRIPPLRERKEDIPALATHFLKMLAPEHGKKVTAIADPVWRIMREYSWPGNVRELRNFIDTLIIFDVDGVLGMDDVPADHEVLQRGAPVAASATGSNGATLIGKPMAEVERYYVEEALKLAGGNREEAARMLGMGERTVYRKIQDWKQHDRIKSALDENSGDATAAAKALEMTEAELGKEMKRLGMSE
jgi:two-component system response regulator HydG